MLRILILGSLTEQKKFLRGKLVKDMVILCIYRIERKEISYNESVKSDIGSNICLDSIMPWLKLTAESVLSLFEE